MQSSWLYHLKHNFVSQLTIEGNGVSSEDGDAELSLGMFLLSPLTQDIEITLAFTTSTSQGKNRDNTLEVRSHILIEVAITWVDVHQICV